MRMWPPITNRERERRRVWGRRALALATALLLAGDFLPWGSQPGGWLSPASALLAIIVTRAPLAALLTPFALVSLVYVVSQVGVGALSLRLLRAPRAGQPHASRPRAHRRPPATGLPGAGLAGDERARLGLADRDLRRWRVGDARAPAGVWLLAGAGGVRLRAAGAIERRLCSVCSTSQVGIHLLWLNHI